MELTFKMKDGRTFTHNVPTPLPPTFDMEEVPNNLISFGGEDSMVLHEPGKRRTFRRESFGPIALAYIEV